MGKKTQTVKQIIDGLGGYIKVAESLKLRPSRVWNWCERDSIPADSAIAFSKISGIPATQLRPDVFGEAA